MPWRRSSADPSERGPLRRPTVRTVSTDARLTPIDGTAPVVPDGRLPRLGRALRSDRGAAVAEFPLVAVLIIVIALAVVQSALIMHTRNTLIDAAVHGA